MNPLAVFVFLLILILILLLLIFLILIFILIFFLSYFLYRATMEMPYFSANAIVSASSIKIVLLASMARTFAPA